MYYYHNIVQQFYCYLKINPSCEFNLVNKWIQLLVGQW